MESGCELAGLMGYGHSWGGEAYTTVLRTWAEQAGTDCAWALKSGPSSSPTQKKHLLARGHAVGFPVLSASQQCHTSGSSYGALCEAVLHSVTEPTFPGVLMATQIIPLGRQDNTAYLLGRRTN